MITISDGVNDFSPLLVTTYEAASDSRNITHTIIGRADPDYSLGGESTRAGMLNMMFSSVAALDTAEALLSQPAVFTLVDTITPSVDMSFVREGTMRRRRGLTQGSWLLDVGFAEVAT